MWQQTMNARKEPDEPIKAKLGMGCYPTAPVVLCTRHWPTSPYRLLRIVFRCTPSLTLTLSSPRPMFGDRNRERESSRAGY